MAKATVFMQFWYVSNQILKSHGLPEMLYGEAKDWWEERHAADGMSETRAQLDELAQQAKGSHRQHIPACEDDALTGVALTKAIEEVIAEDDRQHLK